MAQETQNQPGKAAHAASPKVQQKDNLYQAEYHKRRQSALKGTTRGARK